MRITLVKPPLMRVDHRGDLIIDYKYTQEKFPVCTSVTLEQLAQNSGHETTLIKAFTLGYTMEETLRLILASRPEVLGISCTNVTLESGIALAEETKRALPSIKVIFGGVFPSLLGEKIFDVTDAVDHVVIGDGEHVWSLLDSLPRITERLFDVTVDSYPLRPNLRQEIARGYVPGVQASRGCSFNRCRFCAVAAVNKKTRRRWTPRSIKAIVDEVGYLYNNFSVCDIVFVDEDFLGCQPERGLQLLEQLHHDHPYLKFYIDIHINQVNTSLLLNLRKNGLAGIYVGVDSFSEETLRCYSKGYNGAKAKSKMREIHDVGIPFVAGFIPFNPFASFDQIADDIQTGAEYGITDITRLSHQLVITYGTPIFRRMGYNNRLIVDYAFKDERIEKLQTSIRELHGVQPEKFVPEIHKIVNKLKK